MWKMATTSAPVFRNLVCQSLFVYSNTTAGTLNLIVFIFSKICASKLGVRLIYGCGLYTDVYGIQLDETLLKCFSEKKSQDKSFILNQNFCSLKHNALLSWFCQIVLQCLHKPWEWLLLIGQFLMLSKQDKISSKSCVSYLSQKLLLA